MAVVAFLTKHCSPPTVSRGARTLTHCYPCRLYQLSRCSDRTWYEQKHTELDPILVIPRLTHDLNTNCASANRGFVWFRCQGCTERTFVQMAKESTDAVSLTMVCWKALAHHVVPMTPIHGVQHRTHRADGAQELSHLGVPALGLPVCTPDGSRWLTAYSQ